MLATCARDACRLGPVGLYWEDKKSSTSLPRRKRALAEEEDTKKRVSEEQRTSKFKTQSA